VVDSTGEVNGEAPNVAARVQRTAAPGEIWITRAVHRQIAGLFVAEDKGEHDRDAEARRDEFMLGDSRPVFVVAIPGGPDTSDLVHKALNKGVAVLVLPGPLVGENCGSNIRFRCRVFARDLGEAAVA
jgi:hypothetical protein